MDDASLARLRSLAVSIVERADSRYDAAAAVEGYLCCTPLRDDAGELLLGSDGAPRLLYPFTRDVGLPPLRSDAVTWWLFDNLDADGLHVGGYYDYHASAMAVLLRTLGIPARVSTGYVLARTTSIRAPRPTSCAGSTAYSWVRCSSPSNGWVDFDPTPAVVSEGFAAIAGSASRSSACAPSPRPAGRRRSADRAGPVRRVSVAAGASATNSTMRASASDTGFSPRVWWVLAPLGLLLALLAAGGSSLAAWQRSLRGQTPVERLWTSTQRLSRWGGVRVDPANTPREYATALGAVVRDPEASQRLADTYTRERFSAGALPESHYDQALGAWRALRGRLLRRMFRLPMPARPARPRPRTPCPTHAHGVTPAE